MSHESGVPVGALLEQRDGVHRLPIEVLAGARGLGRSITSPHVQKTGLALAGFDEYLRPGRVLIFGESEIRYLEHLSPDARLNAVRMALRHDFPCILITGGFDSPAALTDEAERVGVPVLRTSVETPEAVEQVSTLLEDALADETVVHGVLLDLLGLGVLLTGESGIGKSECALDLIVRGHRLIADDAVDVKRQNDTVLVGRSPELTRDHMELRGLGIISIPELFGISSTRASKRIELVIRLERWEPGKEYDRLGLNDATIDILGVSVPLLRMPVGPGRNIATLVEVAARNHLLKTGGHHAARAFVERLDNALRRDSANGTPDEVDTERGDT
ncbi:MAG: HPr(Ser) kinase/phosphatase [Vicinamibacterales bacterium]